jgi:hypothetical protein
VSGSLRERREYLVVLAAQILADLRPSAGRRVEVFRSFGRRNFRQVVLRCGPYASGAPLEDTMFDHVSLKVRDFQQAFASPTRAAVARFFAAGIESGGRDNGKPGIRPDYAEDYYAAFLFDPDGNNVEAVTHGA